MITCQRQLCVNHAVVYIPIAAGVTCVVVVSELMTVGVTYVIVVCVFVTVGVTCVLLYVYSRQQV